MTTKFGFDIILDDTFNTLVPDSKLSPSHNKNLLSIINDYENGEWRYEKFENFVWDNIAESTLSAEERIKLAHKPLSQLREAAKNLRFTDKDTIGSGSELAEIVLYAIMKHHFKALPVVPKIFYKQNSQDNAKGADSVHIVPAGNDYSIWFGEAKFYKDLSDANLNDIVNSVEEALKPHKLKKENRIISGTKDLESLIPEKDIRTRILDDLNPENSTDHLKPKLNIPILILHECEKTRDNTELTPEYIEKVRAYHKKQAEKYFKKQIKKLKSFPKYSEIKFHFILFPVASKQIIVNSFIKHVLFYKS